MKNYHHRVVTENGESYQQNLTSDQSAEEQGEQLWKTIPDVVLVEVSERQFEEESGEEFKGDYYIRNR